jgi:hypothetical protein
MKLLYVHFVVVSVVVVVRCSSGSLGMQYAVGDRVDGIMFPGTVVASSKRRGEAAVYKIDYEDGDHGPAHS